MSRASLLIKLWGRPLNVPHDLPAELDARLQAASRPPGRLINACHVC